MNIIETAYSTRNTEGCMRLWWIKIKNCQEYIYFLKAIDKKDEVLCKTIETPEDQKDCVKYVQNLERRFATYNIINAGFNFCDENDVQMLMDGDD